MSREVHESPPELEEWRRLFLETGEQGSKRRTVYEAWGRATALELTTPRKRGPKTALSDAELRKEIRVVLKESDFLGEGHRNVRARMRAKRLRVGKNRVLRLMRENWFWPRSGKAARALEPIRPGVRAPYGRLTLQGSRWGSASGTTGARSTPPPQVRGRPDSGPGPSGPHPDGGMIKPSTCPGNRDRLTPSERPFCSRSSFAISIGLGQMPGGGSLTP